MIGKRLLGDKGVKIVFVLVVICCLSGFVSSPVALFTGMVFAFLFGNPFANTSKKAVNLFLKVAVIGFGFGIDIGEAVRISSEGIWLTTASILVVMVTGYFLARLLKLNHRESHLIVSGTAVCGGSAIAAVAPITGANNQEISMSLGVVFLLNAIALFIFPPIGKLLGLTEFQFGMWSAIAIHDTSSVVGAAYQFGEEALKVATTLKMARVLWIIPISIYTIFLFKRKQTRIRVPWFILLFICAILLNSYFSIPTVFNEFIGFASRSLLIVTLFLIGISLSLTRIRQSGWKTMLFGVSLWVITAVVSLALILKG